MKYHNLPPHVQKLVDAQVGRKPRNRQKHGTTPKPLPPVMDAAVMGRVTVSREEWRTCPECGTRTMNGPLDCEGCPTSEERSASSTPVPRRRRPPPDGHSQARS